MKGKGENTRSKGLSEDQMVGDGTQWIGYNLKGTWRHLIESITLQAIVFVCTCVNGVPVWVHSTALQDKGH